MSTFRISTEKEHTYIEAKNLAQARIASQHIFPKAEDITLREATQEEVDKLIRSHSLPMKEH